MKLALRKAESTLQYNVRWRGGSRCKLETVAIPSPARPDQLAADQPLHSYSMRITFPPSRKSPNCKLKKVLGQGGGNLCSSPSLTAGPG